MEFEPVIGLEVHAQLKTHTKIFCGCSTAFGAPANTQVCPVCLGMPGVLPVLNKKVVDYTIKMALATGCTISPESRFARKNYFYPDLPKGYQISQYELPVAEKGCIDIEVRGVTKCIGITRIHMEEDAGKLIHDPDRPASRVDLNRTGVPLMEIVSEPDMRSPEEAGAYLRLLRSILRYLNISDGNMQEGSFRCDANVSIRPKGSDTLGTRTELKNLNSFRFVEKAIAHEIARQREVLMDGGRILQETRLYDSDQDVTRSMRGKEEAHDYRYFPDPDLLPLIIDPEWIESIRRTLPELPNQKKHRYALELGLSASDAEMLTAEKETALFFESCISCGAPSKAAANWIMGPLMGFLNSKSIGMEASPISADQLSGLIALIEKGVISGKIAKTVFDEMSETGQPADIIVKEKGLVQVSDPTAIAEMIERLMAQNPEQVNQYRSGKTKVFGFFVGQVMKESRGQANPQMVNDLLKTKLDGN
jgi:aspartyl-tRNA(Asn)/glutamyl-tRNA(Gln) amidotransferase subunit B